MCKPVVLLIMGGTEILELVWHVENGLQFEAEFQRLAHVPQLLGRSLQRVWSRFIVLCRGGALVCDKLQVLRHCA